MAGGLPSESRILCSQAKGKKEIPSMVSHMSGSCTVSIHPFVHPDPERIHQHACACPGPLSLQGPLGLVWLLMRESILGVGWTADDQGCTVTLSLQIQCLYLNTTVILEVCINWLYIWCLQLLSTRREIREPETNSLITQWGLPGNSWVPEVVVSGTLLLETSWN